jgi:broad specificity phosphatase PhoE
MSRLFLIRHAEPASSWGGADHDPGLTEQGRAQAEAAARVLSHFGRLETMTSPMRRCQETAAPFGLLSGQTPRVERAVSEVAAPAGVSDRPAWLRSNFPWDDGVERRTWRDVDPALRAWREDAVGAMCAIQRDVAVFSHFIAINAIVGAAMESEETIVFRPGHASITELALEGGKLRVIKLGTEAKSADVR